jgi:glycosyltransferase involved in cell wall biosynthesis/O-antigen/teichoic acid export membrane protein
VHVLVLADRDWTHPEAGGSGHNLRRQVEQFTARGHRVSVIAAGYRGGAAHESMRGVEIHRVGGRTTVFPHAIWRQARGLVPDADVVLEVINGITFLTPLWLRTPRVALVHHIHAGPQYREEMGLLGRPAAALLETIPLRRLYRSSRFVCVSRATQTGVISRGIPRRQTSVSHNGVDADMFVEPRRSPTPRFLVLGRLKRYKRIELLLDALTEIPDAHLDIVGEGSHKAAIVAAVERLGLEQQVTLHGYVSEADKRELLRSTWANLTASAAEGWGLTIAEAAACGTPSVGLATGGLREAIAHERTGLLARDVTELRGHLIRLASDVGLVERLGATARERVRELTWERTADVTLAALESELESAPAAGRKGALDRLFANTARAAGLAGAVMANSALALICTILFARWLGSDSYGTLASLLACFLMLTIPGSALQTAVARDISRNPDGPAEAMARRALAAVLWLAVPVAGLLILARGPIASVLGVDLQWASAAAVWFGWLWVGLSLQRGLCQGRRRYRQIGVSLVVEAAGRLLFGAAMLALGFGATGALLGTGFAIAASSAVLARADGGLRLRGRPADLWRLARGGGAPLWALSLVAVIQNADVIIVRHRMSHVAAGVYAEAVVAARGILWLGVGLGLFLLPEAARRARRSEDARGVLLHMMGLVCLVSVPLTALYAVGGASLLRLVFDIHRDPVAAGTALAILSVAMTLLALSYLVVQYLLAMRRRSFAVPLMLAALAEGAAVVIAAPSFDHVALAMLGVQALLLAMLLGTALSPRRHASSGTAPGVATRLTPGAPVASDAEEMVLP